MSLLDLRELNGKKLTEIDRQIDRWIDRWVGRSVDKLN